MIATRLLEKKRNLNNSEKRNGRWFIPSAVFQYILPDSILRLSRKPHR